MTKYILNSGSSKKDKNKAVLSFNEMLKGFENKPKILICLFAQKREDWEIKFQEYQEYFSKILPTTEPVFELAFPDNITEQVKSCNILVIYGGDDHLLLYWLNKYDLPKLWENKVVVASSASCNILSKHFWTCDWRQCFDGLGILPIKFLSHYKSTYGDNDPRGPIDWDKAYKELEDYGDKTLPIYALKEGEYVVIEK